MSARWIQHPSQSNLPPYFDVDLNSVKIVNVVSAPGNPVLKSEVEAALSKRLNIMQSGSSSEFATAGIPPNPSKKWIVVPARTPLDSFSRESLVQNLLSFKGQAFQISNPRGGTGDEPMTIQLVGAMNISQVQHISISVNRPASGDAQPVSFTIKDLSKRIPKGAAEGNITIELYPLKSQCNHPSQTEAEQRSATVVAQLYEELYDKGRGLTLNSFDPIPSQYNSMLAKWVSPFQASAERVQTQVQWASPKGELEITGLPVVYDVKVNPGGGSAADFNSLQDRLHSRGCQLLVGLPLTQRGQTMFEYLAKQDPATKDVTSSYTNGDFQLNITPQPTLAKLIASGGISYSNGTGWTGKLSATGQDLIWSEKFYDLANTLQASYQGGGSYQNASLTAAVTKPSRDPLALPEFYSFVVGGNFVQNQNQRYGGQLPGQTLTVSETQATAALKLSYDSFSIFDESDALNVAPPTRKRNRNQIVVQPGFMFDRFSVFSNHSAFQNGGNILQFSVTPDYLFTHDFERQDKTRGWSELDVESRVELIKGLSAGGFNGFDRYQGTITASAFLGWRSTRQFLVRSQYGFGSLSAGGPIVRVFQLGGTEVVPGVQLGEFSGQTLAFSQSQFGIDLPSIIALFHRKVPPETKLFDIRRSYLEFEYSQAAASQRESLAAVAGLSPAVQSFGPAVEIGRFQNLFDLTAGYMYSPQSTLHTHGTFLLTVHVNDIRQR